MTELERLSREVVRRFPDAGLAPGTTESLTDVASPDGGTERTPMGTVFIGAAGPGTTAWRNATLRAIATKYGSKTPAGRWKWRWR